jgi:hypothetical protein
MTIEGIINKISTQILNPIIVLLFTLAMILFLWGIIKYVIASQGDAGKLENAKNSILYGIIGMFIMASAWGFVTILQNFFLP